MKILITGFLGVFFSFNLFAGPFCIDAKNQAQLRKVIDDASKAGVYSMKKMMGKDVVFKVGDRFKNADSNKDCNKEDCRIAGFCEYAVYGRSDTYSPSNFCIGVLLPVNKSEGDRLGLGCIHMEELVPVK